MQDILVQGNYFQNITGVEWFTLIINNKCTPETVKHKYLICRRSHLGKTETFIQCEVLPRS